MVAERPWRGQSDIYDHTRPEVDTWLGATSAYVAAWPDRISCRRPVGSFSALGPFARDLIEAEEERDVYGPLRALAAISGWVVPIGVSLTSMTLLHLAEVEAGRRPFMRWARGPDGQS